MICKRRSWLIIATLHTNHHRKANKQFVIYTIIYCARPITSPGKVLTPGNIPVLVAAQLCPVFDRHFRKTKNQFFGRVPRCRHVLATLSPRCSTAVKIKVGLRLPAATLYYSLAVATWCLAAATWCLAAATWCLAAATWCLAAATWCLAIATWCLAAATQRNMS